VTMSLPGGRYSCARALIQRGLSCLGGYSLGKACHIVQLSISRKKILGYLNGTLVPYSESQSMVKERHAISQRPCSGSVQSKIPVATWDVLFRCVEVLVQEVEAGALPTPLSNIKRLFRAKFHFELSETALGYAKVSELLQDQRFWGLCEVKLRGHGYVMLPAAERRAQKEPVAAAVKPTSAPAEQGAYGDDHLVLPRLRRRMSSSFAEMQAATPSQCFDSTPSPCSLQGLPRLLGTRRFGLPEAMEPPAPSASKAMPPLAPALGTLTEEPAGMPAPLPGWCGVPPQEHTVSPAEHAHKVFMN